MTWWFRRKPDTDIHTLKVEIENLKLFYEMMEKKLDFYIKETKTLRKAAYRIKDEEEGGQEENASGNDMRTIMEAFGGSVPIELAEKYKREQ
jgi:hypothetical protein